MSLAVVLVLLMCLTHFTSKVTSGAERLVIVTLRNEAN